MMAWKEENPRVLIILAHIALERIPERKTSFIDNIDNDWSGAVQGNTQY